MFVLHRNPSADRGPRPLGPRRLGSAGYLCLALLLAGSIVHVFMGFSHFDQQGHAWGTDDAYISYRYASNLIHGQGLVFNPGEYVEGYSNFLYVLLIALLSLSGIAAYTCSVVLNLGLIAAAFLLYYSFVRRKLSPDRAAAAGLAFALAPPVWVWVASGMETPLVLLLLIGMWIILERVAREESSSRDLRLLGLVLILSLLTRADGFVPVGIALFYLLIHRRWRALGRCGAAALLAMAGYVAWRYWYYGHPLPNTYYVKVSGPLMERLWAGGSLLISLAYLRGLFPYLAIFSVVVAATAIRLNRKKGRDLRIVGFETVFAVSWLAYFFYIGGDVFEDRFLVILYPMGAYLIMRELGDTLRGRPLAIVVTLLIVAQLGVFRTDVRFQYTTSKFDRLCTLGEFFHDRYSEKTLAIDGAGKVPYFSGMRTIDILGLTDEKIGHMPASFFHAGHNKFDPQYVLSRKPDFIATWISRTLDMQWGLDKKLYDAAGYKVRFLVSKKNPPPGKEILDVAGMKDFEVAAAIASGMSYGVLEKQLQ